MNTGVVIIGCVLSIFGLASLALTWWAIRRDRGRLADTAAELARLQASKTKEAVERSENLAKQEAQATLQSTQNNAVQEASNGLRTLSDLLRSFRRRH